MNKSFKNICLVTNEVAKSSGAEETALHLAKQSGSRVIIIDSVRTPFYAPHYMSVSADLMFEVAIKSKEKYLDEVANRFRKMGVDVKSEVLVSSRTSTDIIATALGESCDLIIRYLKGSSSRTSGRFGQTAQNLMSASEIPLLFIDNAIDQPKVAAFVDVNHSEHENRAIVNAAKQIAVAASDISIISFWESIEYGLGYQYVDTGLVEQTNEEAIAFHRKRFNALPTKLDAVDLQDQMQLLQGNPIDMIPKYCTDHKIDVAVMCSASLEHSFGSLFGNTVTRVIDQLPCSLLVVKPIGFQSSIQPKPLKPNVRNSV